MPVFAAINLTNFQRIILMYTIMIYTRVRINRNFPKFKLL
jgi:hypothetical protein